MIPMSMKTIYTSLIILATTSSMVACGPRKGSALPAATASSTTTTLKKANTTAPTGTPASTGTPVASVSTINTGADNLTPEQLKVKIKNLEDQLKVADLIAKNATNKAAALEAKAKTAEEKAKVAELKAIAAKSNEEKARAELLIAELKLKNKSNEQEAKPTKITKPTPVKKDIAESSKKPGKSDSKKVIGNKPTQPVVKRKSAKGKRVNSEPPAVVNDQSEAARQAEQEAAQAERLARQQAAEQERLAKLQEENNKLIGNSSVFANITNDDLKQRVLQLRESNSLEQRNADLILASLIKDVNFSRPTDIDKCNVNIFIQTNETPSSPLKEVKFSGRCSDGLLKEKNESNGLNRPFASAKFQCMDADISTETSTYGNWKTCETFLFTTRIPRGNDVLKDGYMNLAILLRDFQMTIKNVNFQNIYENSPGQQYKDFFNILVASTEQGKQNYPYAYRLKSAKMHSAEVIEGITVAEMTFVGTDLNIIPSTAYWYVVNPSSPFLGIKDYATCKVARPSQLNGKDLAIANEVQFINILENLGGGEIKLQMGFRNSTKSTPDRADLLIINAPKPVRHSFSY